MHFYCSDGQGRVLINTQWQAQRAQHEMLLWPDHWTACHNSDLRDSHEYTQKQVWGEQIFMRQSGMMFGSVTTIGWQKFLALSAYPTYLETISVHSDVTQIWAVCSRWCWWFSWPFTRFMYWSQHLGTCLQDIYLSRLCDLIITQLRQLMRPSQIQLYNADEEILLLTN